MTPGFDYPKQFFVRIGGLFKPKFREYTRLTFTFHWTFSLPQACVLVCPNSVGLCSVREIGTEQGMRLGLDELAAASREALMAEWREVVGRSPPGAT